MRHRATGRFVDHDCACPSEDESECPDEFRRKVLHALSATQCSSQNESILAPISSANATCFSPNAPRAAVNLDGSSNDQCNELRGENRACSASDSLHNVITYVICVCRLPNIEDRLRLLRKCRFLVLQRFYSQKIGAKIDSFCEEHCVADKA